MTTYISIPNLFEALVKIVLIVIIAPILGGLISGIDRKISAKMQGRVGPSILQPFYDVLKLWEKESIYTSPLTLYFVALSLCFTVFTVVLFFMGGNFLLCIFAFTLVCMFFVLAGYSSNSPYSFIGSERELLQIMCYEPMMLIFAFSFYKVTGSFNISSISALDYPVFFQIPLVFVAFLTVLTVKLRKSPFDLSTSHHGHQEIVKGITTEMTGKTLAMVEIMHWYETIFALGLVFIFFVSSSIITYPIAFILTMIIYFSEIVVDNSFARIKWEKALRICWGTTISLGGLNLIYLFMLR